MFRRIVLALFLFLVPVSQIYADCQASVYAHDWYDNFQSVNDVRDFCQKRMRWWQIDNSYFDKACNTRRITKQDEYGRDYDAYSVNFWWRLGQFRGYNDDQVWDNIGTYIKPRTFQGWPVRISIMYDENCPQLQPPPPPY